MALFRDMWLSSPSILDTLSSVWQPFLLLIRKGKTLPSLGATNANCSFDVLFCFDPQTAILDLLGSHFGTLGAPFGDPGLLFGVF